MRKWISLLLALALLSGLAGCGGDASSAGEPARPVLTKAPAKPYVAGDFAEASFHRDRAEGEGEVWLDLSALPQGYVAVSVRSEKRLKFQVIQGETTYNYDIASDGTPSVFPLQMGDGEYRFRVMENVEGSKYGELYAASAEVSLSDEFQPFLRPSDYVNYSRDSECVRKAAQLAEGAGDAVGLVGAVYEYVCANVSYDREKAARVASGYLPDPDETLQTGRGICFDYASLAAAMLRSQGIPTKVIFGYVSPDGLYHAWNMFYTRETGWVTVGFEVSGNSWNRLDLTFSANGADAAFIGDGGNYSDLYTY